jgi:hypothetical protein
MSKVTLFVLMMFVLSGCGGGGGSSSGGLGGSQPVDTVPPVITVNGGDVTITQSTPYSDPGASALDNKDGVVSVHTSNPVNTMKSAHILLHIQLLM